MHSENDNILDAIKKIFQSKARLGIMTVLVSEGESDFSNLKSRLDLTDGNLSSHLRKLEEAKYLEVEKKFVDRKPRTLYRPTDKGRKEFKRHLEQLKEVIDLVEKEEKPNDK